MTAIPETQLLDQLRWRYAVKKFDSEKKIAPEKWKILEECLVLTPSSYGLQPWKFLVIQDPTIRKQLRVHSWNQSQVEDCSHYVVFTALRKINAEDVDAYINRIVEIRGVAPESLEGFKRSMSGDVIHGSRSLYAKEWAIRQLYIALGNFMTSAAVMGVDACPMEGLDADKYEDVLGLKDSPWTVAMACAAGFRHPDDRLARMAKVRFPANAVIEYR